MTNKNKNIKRLVKAATTEPPSQFEIIPTLTQPVYGPDAANETDADTFDAERDELELEGKSAAELRGLLRSRAKSIEELRYQLEQALARRRGLEKELQVREEITSSVNDDVKSAQQQLKAAARDLESLGNAYAALQQLVAETDIRAEALGEETARYRSETERKEQRIQDLQQQLEASRVELSDLRAYVDGRRKRWKAHQVKLAETNQLLATSQAECARISDELLQREESLCATDSELQETRASLTAMQADVIRLREDNLALRSTLDGDANRELRKVRDKIAIQSGELAARAQELESLRKDNERFESYADLLRTRLQDQTVAAETSNSERYKLECSLEEASSLINDLSNQLAESQARERDLDEGNKAQKEVYEQEIRQIRFELTGAQTTIADQASVNEQLASDLVDNQGFRQALEAHLNESEEESQETIRKLTRKLEMAREKAAEYERRLGDKDKAYADLLQKLESQSSTLELRSDLENALKKIDGHRQDRQPVRRKGERDHRIARMLVGSADGRDLRFPLFKNRLTIGRTPHNDIHLDLRFVSRRHAVIATDHNKTRVIDWGSRNGVYVNQKRVTEKILKSGDIITIGLTNLRFEERPKR